MPQFNVGDRVRRVRFSHDIASHDPERFGVLGQVYTVRRCVLGTVNLHGLTGDCSPNNFELVVAPTRPEPNTEIFLVFGKGAYGNLQTWSFDNMAAADAQSEYLRRSNIWTYKGRKKIKLYVDWDAEETDDA